MTKLTSMVVVPPNQEDNNQTDARTLGDARDLKEGKADSTGSKTTSFSSRSGSRAPGATFGSAGGGGGSVSAARAFSGGGPPRSLGLGTGTTLGGLRRKTKSRARVRGMHRIRKKTFYHRECFLSPLFRSASLGSAGRPDATPEAAAASAASCKAKTAAKDERPRPTHCCLW